MYTHKQTTLRMPDSSWIRNIERDKNYRNCLGDVLHVELWPSIFHGLFYYDIIFNKATCTISIIIQEKSGNKLNRGPAF